MTWIIIALCVSGFIWQESLDYRTAHNIVYQLGFIPAVFFTPANLPENMTLVPEWSTIFTSMFLHAGWMHIGGNMLYLWIFGDNVEAAMGTRQICAVLHDLRHRGGNGTSRTRPQLDHSHDWCVWGDCRHFRGISIASPKSRDQMFFLILIFFRFINLPAWLVLGVWIGGQFVAIPQALSETGGGVAYLAHIGGFLAGMALIPFFKYRHIALFDRDIGLQDWADRPLNFQEVKAEARARYRRAAPAFSDPARGVSQRAHQKALCLYRAAKSQNLVMITKPDHGDRLGIVPRTLMNRRPTHINNLGIGTK